MPVVLHREGPVFRCETSAHLDQHKHGDTCQKPAQGNSPRLSPLIAKLKMRQSVRHLASANKKFFPAPGYAGVLRRSLCVCSCGNCCLSMSDTPHAHHFCFIEWLRICTYQKEHAVIQHAMTCIILKSWLELLPTSCAHVPRRCVRAFPVPQHLSSPPSAADVVVLVLCIQYFRS
jgi:hypothetical protein